VDDVSPPTPRPASTGPIAPGDVWVVAGPPGGGKSTLAAVLARMLRPAGAVLDKDTLFAGFVAEVLAAHGREHGEREGPWYDEHVKVHEYAGMAASAAQIRAAGCPVVLVAPYTGQLRDADRWARLVTSVGGDPVRLVWVRSDADTVRRRLLARGRARDSGKLAGFEEFVARVSPQTPPVVPHLAVDCRDGAPPVADQLARLGVGERDRGS
jgi:energy-coupling factor transporter ATP-binding protein EcfA2